MTQYKINSPEDFVQHFGKTYNPFRQDRDFVLSLIITIIGFFLFFFSMTIEYKDYDPYTAKPSEFYQKRIYQVIYSSQNNEEKKVSTSNTVPQRRVTTYRRNPIPKIKDEDIAELKIFTRENNNDDSKLLDDISTDLASIDDLDNILNDFELNYQLEKNREAIINNSTVSFLEPEIEDVGPRVNLERRKTNLKFAEQKISIRREAGYRSASDIKAINRSVENNNKMITLCYQKFKRKYPTLKGSIKVEFYIDKNGKVIKETVKVINTNIEQKEFIQCFIKQVKRIRNIPLASNNAKGNYLFSKKWVF